MSLVTAGVLATEVDGHEDAEDTTHGGGGDEGPVTTSVVGSVVLAVDKARDSTTEVTEADVHGNTDTTLERTADVVAVPGDTLGNVGVDTAGDEESTKVLGAVGFDSGEDDETNYSDNAESNHVDTTLAVLISSETATDGEEAGDNVGRDRHELSNLVGVAKTLDNGGKEDGDGVERGVDANGDEHVNPDLPVLESILGELEIETIRQNRAILFKTTDDLLTLRVVKELGSVGVVVHDEEGCDSKDESEKALNDKDPGPAVETTNTVHLHNTTSKETTKGTGSSGSREEDGHTETALVTLVPESDVVGDTREQATFGKTKSHTRSKEATKVVSDTHEGGADGPGNHDGGNPDGRAEALHGHVGGDLGGDVEGKEDGDGDVVVPLARHAQSLLEACELCVSDVGSVEEGEEVEESKEGEELDIHLAQETLGGGLVKDFLGGILVKRDGLFIVDLVSRRVVCLVVGHLVISVLKHCGQRCQTKKEEREERETGKCPQKEKGYGRGGDGCF